LRNIFNCIRLLGMLTPNKKTRHRRRISLHVCGGLALYRSDPRYARSGDRSQYEIASFAGDLFFKIAASL
jgi:hypothetical protein